jgi:hypothetical protein
MVYYSGGVVNSTSLHDQFIDAASGRGILHVFL